VKIQHKSKIKALAEGSSDCKFWNLLKIMVLISFELSLPLSWASCVVKVNASTNTRYMLVKP
jgi:hypothetical protein